jgi:hypothetical protein
MAEAFVKTFKRDCVRINSLPDARTALSRIDHWMEDTPAFPAGLPLTAGVHCITSTSRIPESRHHPRSYRGPISGHGWRTEQDFTGWLASKRAIILLGMDWHSSAN